VVVAAVTTSTWLLCLGSAVAVTSSPASLWSYGACIGVAAAGLCLCLPWPAVVVRGGAAGVLRLLLLEARVSVSSELLRPAVEARGGVFWSCRSGAGRLGARRWSWVGGRGGGAAGTAWPPRRQVVLVLEVGAAWPCLFIVKISVLAPSG